MTNAPQTSIARVTCYQATPVECCDRCAAGIKNVFLVLYRDGERQRYGSECINKILAGDTSLRGLFNRNVKRLKTYQNYLRVLQLPEDRMPRGREYFDSGLYFIGDGRGGDVSFGHWYFHPLYDADKNSAGPHYVVHNAEEHVAKCRAAIQRDLPLIEAEIARIEKFLGRVIAKGLLQQAVQ